MKNTFLKISIAAVAVVTGFALAVPETAYAQNNARSGGSNSGGQRSGSGSGGNNGPSTSSPRSSDGSGTRSSSGSSQSEGSGRAVAAAGSRENDGNRVIGTAVARQGRPVRDGDTIFVRSFYPLGYYPWGYGSYGFGLGYGGFGFGYSAFGYDPWGSGFYDPFYGYPRGYVAAPWGRGNYDGSLKLKVSPSDATVYVDGFYAGVVDDYDGMFQRLHLEPGAHRVEIRKDGYETLTFDVRITPDRTITYSGELTKP